jgi:hypothetical protein
MYHYGNEDYYKTQRALQEENNLQEEGLGNVAKNIASGARDAVATAKAAVAGIKSGDVDKAFSGRRLKMFKNRFKRAFQEFKEETSKDEIQQRAKKLGTIKGSALASALFGQTQGNALIRSKEFATIAKNQFPDLNDNQARVATLLDILVNGALSTNIIGRVWANFNSEYAAGKPKGDQILAALSSELKSADEDNSDKKELIKKASDAIDANFNKLKEYVTSAIEAGELAVNINDILDFVINKINNLFKKKNIEGITGADLLDIFMDDIEKLVNDIKIEANKSEEEATRAAAAELQATAVEDEFRTRMEQQMNDILDHLTRN